MLTQLSTIKSRLGIDEFDLKDDALLTRAIAARSFAGRVVYFQRRRSNGHWRTVRRLVLDRSSSRRFRVTLPSGRWRVRVVLPSAQAGAGYLAGFSRTLSLRR